VIVPEIECEIIGEIKHDIGDQMSVLPIISVETFSFTNLLSHCATNVQTQFCESIQRISKSDLIIECCDLDHVKWIESMLRQKYVTFVKVCQPQEEEQAETNLEAQKSRLRSDSESKSDSDSEVEAEEKEEEEAERLTAEQVAANERKQKAEQTVHQSVDSSSSHFSHLTLWKRICALILILI
jgi:flagellar biosynthesis GTPase FlhF